MEPGYVEVSLPAGTGQYDVMIAIKWFMRGKTTGEPRPDNEQNQNKRKRKSNGIRPPGHVRGSRIIRETYTPPVDAVKIVVPEYFDAADIICILDGYKSHKAHARDRYRKSKINKTSEVQSIDQSV